MMLVMQCLSRACIIHWPRWQRAGWTRENLTAWLLKLTRQCGMMISWGRSLQDHLLRVWIITMCWRVI